jgi:DNA end-binding protein Ku
VREREVELAKQLVDQIAAETFNPNEYEDDVRKRIQADVDRKIAGKEIAVSPEPAETGRVIDLMEALKASLGAKRPSRPAEDQQTQQTQQTEEKAPAPMERKPARAASLTGEAAANSKIEHRRRSKRAS